ncbi:MAG: OmpH family outer membrane protein [Armatimonadetes bacterium]|nr:OmpH family outer membrane protein [Armatimonadota bacterium]
MQNQNFFSKYGGWGVAFVLLGVMVGSGFQGGTEKTGVVDLNKVIQMSDSGKASTDKLNAQLKLRRGLIDFVTTYKVLTREQAERLKELTLKVTPTEEEKKEIEKIKADVIASDKRRNDLSQKQTLTDAERELIREYSQRALAMEDLVSRWSGDFQNELEDLQKTAQQATIDKAKLALQTVAKAGGFTIVMETTVAPFGVNDLTDATTKQMNTAK